MNLSKWVPLAAALLAMASASCAPFVHLVPVGPNRYAVETGQSFTGREEAYKHCSKMGKRVNVLNSEQRYDGATTVFECY